MKKPHPITVLHKNALGQVRKCDCCDEIQLLFGTVYCTSSLEHFKKFRQQILKQQNRMFCEYARMKCNGKLLLGTSCEGLRFALNRQEFDALLELVNTASIMLEAETLIRVEE